MRVLLSPAKVNVFFYILGKRSDGYHEIASLFQTMDLCDQITLEQSASDVFTCSDPSLPCDDTNLVVRALQLFRKRYSLQFGVRIHLEKQIPLQAGLGGGSSNAATVLWGLNELFARPASIEQLIDLGRCLGSDVPFFFSSGSSYCTGRGDKLESAVLSKPLQGWVIKPDFGLSTPRVFQKVQPEDYFKQNPSTILGAMQTYDTEDFSFYSLLHNDLEPAAFRLEPKLKYFREKLEQMGFDSVNMTGSGSAFFCMGKKAAVDVKQAFCTPVRSIERPHLDQWYSF